MIIYILKLVLDTRTINVAAFTSEEEATSFAQLYYGWAKEMIKVEPLFFGIEVEDEDDEDYEDEDDDADTSNEIELENRENINKAIHTWSEYMNRVEELLYGKQE